METGKEGGRGGRGEDASPSNLGVISSSYPKNPAASLLSAPRMDAKCTNMYEHMLRRDARSPNGLAGLTTSQEATKSHKSHSNHTRLLDGKTVAIPPMRDSPRSSRTLHKRRVPSATLWRRGRASELCDHTTTKIRYYRMNTHLSSFQGSRTQRILLMNDSSQGFCLPPLPHPSLSPQPYPLSSK